MDVIRTPPQHQVDPDKAPGQIKQLSYMDTVNSLHFKAASQYVYMARQRLKEMGMTQQESFDWIKTWASGAGDGSE